MSLTARVERDHLDHVVITGMGGSYYAAIPLWLRLAAAGRPATLIDTAELLHTAPNLVTPRSLLVMVTQSGETIEAVRLLERVGGRAPLVAVTNGRDNTVARAADYSLATAAGAEQSVSGKSYVTSLLALDALGRALIGLPLAPERWEAPIAAVRALLDDWERVEATLASALGAATPLYVLARGASLATACAGALTIKEASRRPAEGMSAAQFRHGPLEMIAPGMGAILLAPASATRPLIYGLAAELAGYGVATAVVGPPDRPRRSTGLTRVRHAGARRMARPHRRDRAVADPQPSAGRATPAASRAASTAWTRSRGRSRRPARSDWMGGAMLRKMTAS